METGTASPTASADSEVGAPWVLLGIWGCREAEGQLLGHLCGADIPIWRDLPSSPQLVWQICQQVRAEWLSPDLAGLPEISLPADGLIRRPPRDASVPPRLQLYTCVCAHTRTHTRTFPALHLPPCCIGLGWRGPSLPAAGLRLGLDRPSLGLRVRISRMGEQCPLAAAVSIKTNACHILVSDMNFTGPYLPVTPFCPLILSLFLSL